MSKIIEGVRRLVIRRTLEAGIKKHGVEMTDEQKRDIVNHAITTLSGDRAKQEHHDENGERFKLMLEHLPHVEFEVYANCSACENTGEVETVPVIPADKMPPMLVRMLEEASGQPFDPEALAQAKAIAIAAKATETDFDENNVLHVHQVIVVRSERTLVVTPEDANKHRAQMLDLQEKMKDMLPDVDEEDDTN